MFYNTFVYMFYNTAYRNNVYKKDRALFSDCSGIKNENARLWLIDGSL